MKSTIELFSKNCSADPSWLLEEKANTFEDRWKEKQRKGEILTGFELFLNISIGLREVDVEDKWEVQIEGIEEVGSEYNR